MPPAVAIVRGTLPAWMLKYVSVIRSWATCHAIAQRIHCGIYSAI